MTAVSNGVAGEANKPEGGNAREISVVYSGGQFCPPVCFAVMARDLWGSKAPMVIGVQYRGRPLDADFSTERRWCRQEGDADAQVLINIQRGPEGYTALARIMRDNPPAWWTDLMRLKECAEAYEARRKRG